MVEGGWIGRPQRDVADQRIDVIQVEVSVIVEVSVDRQDLRFKRSHVQPPIRHADKGGTALVVVGRR